MFASTFYLEREPMSLGELPAGIRAWLQNAGGLAAMALLIVGIAWFLEPPQTGSERAPRALVMGCVVLSGLLYAALGLLLLAFKLGAAPAQRWLPSNDAGGPLTVGDYLLTAAGSFACLAVLIPVLVAIFTRLRWQRIWALAHVSLKEALRKRVLWVFAAMALVFLFAQWFISNKPEDQIRNYVSLVYFAIIVLFLLTASLLGAFGIPNDVKSQSIHTIVTKPVEKFEIVLGRFLGYGLLLTVGLAVIAGLSLIYVLRGVNADAEYESLKARVPIYGMLRFWQTEGDTFRADKGVSVGREWDYRRYISGPQPNKKTGHQYASWFFGDLPAELAERDGPVQFEFTFDVFRLNKGLEGKGIYCTFTFADGAFLDGQHGLLDVEKAVASMREERTLELAELAKKPMSPEQRQEADSRIFQALIGKYGVVEVPAFEVTDYHTQTIEVPSAFFKRLGPAVQLPRPQMTVLVSVDGTSFQQMLGVARRDLYLLAAEGTFAVNFFKGIMGLWCIILFVLGVGIACSTYLSGVISWLCTMFLLGAGLFTDYIQQLAEGKTVGGGPLEAAYRIMTRATIATSIDPSPTADILLGTDEIYRWILRRFLNLIPDINRHEPAPLCRQRVRYPLGPGFARGQLSDADCLSAALGHPGLLLDEIPRDRQPNVDRVR